MSRFSLILTSSFLKTWLTCPTKYKYSRLESIKHKDTYIEAFDKGTIIHSLLQNYYTFLSVGESCNNSARLAVEKTRQEINGKFPKLASEDREFIKLRFLQYATFYKETRDIQPLMLEGNPALEVGFSYPIVDNEHFLFVIEGRIDFIAYFPQSGINVIVDHKSQSKFYNYYDFDPQFQTYALAAKCPYVMVNYFGLQKKFDERTFRRQLISYTPAHQERWRKFLITKCYEIANAILTDSFSQEYMSCTGKYNSLCEYTELCEQTKPELVQIMKERDYVKVPEYSSWD